MAVTVHAEGSQTAVIGTEHSLVTSPETTAAVFQVFIDVANMAIGDVLEIRIYEKTRTGDTQRVVFDPILSGAQGTPTWVSPALMLSAGWNVTIKQTAGTGRAFPWSIRKV